MSLSSNQLEHTIYFHRYQVTFAPVQTQLIVLSCGFTLRHWTPVKADCFSCSNLTNRDITCKHHHTTTNSIQTSTLAVVGFVMYLTTVFVLRPACKQKHSARNC